MGFGERVPGWTGPTAGMPWLHTQLGPFLRAMPDCLWEGRGLRVGCLAWQPGRGRGGSHSIFTTGRRGCQDTPEAEGASEARTPGGEGELGFRAGSLPRQGCGEGQLHQRRAFGQQKSPTLLPELWSGGGGLASPPPPSSPRSRAAGGGLWSVLRRGGGGSPPRGVWVLWVERAGSLAEAAQRLQRV